MSVLDLFALASVEPVGGAKLVSAVEAYLYIGVYLVNARFSCLSSVIS